MNLHNWKNIAVSAQSTIKNALQVMDRSALQIALVVSDEELLLGTVTDGDIRRGLLAGETLESLISEIMNSKPLTGNILDREVLWLKYIQQYQIRHLPILDKSLKIGNYSA